MSANTRAYIATGCALLATIFSIVGVATPGWLSESETIPELGISLTTQSGLFQATTKFGDIEVASAFIDLAACEVTVSATDPNTGTTTEEVLDADPEGTGACQSRQAVAAFTIIGVILSFVAFCASLITARAGSRPAKTAGVVTLVVASVCFLIATAIFGSDSEDALDLGEGGLSYGYSFALVLVALFLDVIGAVFLYMYSSNKA